MPSPSPRLKLRLTPAAEKAVRSGHPWVFADRIKSQNRPGHLGDVAIVYDRHDKFLALGLFDPHSPIRLRILHAGAPVTTNDTWWQERMHASIGRRHFNNATTAYRLINGESDGWPGLVLDRYDDNVVLKLYSATWLTMLDSICRWITVSCAPKRIVLRLSRNIQEFAEQKFQKKDGEILLGTKLSGPVPFLENSLRFEADLIQGQKTGFFLDQRENRRFVGDLARDAVVLNLFSHAGGFSVYAAAAGAAVTIDLDISAHALKSAERNMALNRSLPAVQACRHETIKADTFAWLGSDDGKKYDIIIIDPPSMAKRQADVPAALAAYNKLAANCLTRLRPDGILVAASCSAHVTAKEFFQTIHQTAAHHRCPYREIHSSQHASDHPATFTEAHYLKCIYLKLEGRAKRR